MLSKAFEEELGESALQVNEGKNYLIFEMLKEIVTQFLAWDKADAPFTILGLEEEVKVSNFRLLMGVSLHCRVVSTEGTGWK
jgi:hypothetical protein